MRTRPRRSTSTLDRLLALFRRVLRRPPAVSRELADAIRYRERAKLGELHSGPRVNGVDRCTLMCPSNNLSVDSDDALALALFDDALLQTRYCSDAEADAYGQYMIRLAELLRDAERCHRYFLPPEPEK